MRSYQVMFNPNTVIGSDFSPGQLRSTKSYIFKTEDILGEGATSKVFLGRNKKDGEKVAVKVFNNASFDRPSAVQEREFDLLHKIKHENIVQLLAIENDQISKHRIIIMELCDNSVLNMLDKPEYIYGFPEKEFLQVLGDATSGMKYLKEQGIVHRDIKPGNIMRKLGTDGKTMYKLADFGAARQLQEDENFTSLYGTEEYLHPHVFERALLKKPMLTPFTSKIDLWSLGVTIYHIATGVLPFRPYGGRKNRNTMHKLTTQKATGVISAVQRESEDGPIEYGTELPKHCKLSTGLKRLITELLVGLLESDTEKMWSFEVFFDKAQTIVNKRSFDIHNVASAQLLRIYIDPNLSYAEFQEHIAKQTSIASDQQILIYDNDHFHPDSSVTCASYPVTSEEHPIILIPIRFNGCGTPIPPIAPSMPEIKSNYSLEGDYPISRICVGVLHFMQRKQDLLLTMTSNFNAIAKVVRCITKNQIMQLTVHLADVNAKKQFVDNSLKRVEDKTTIILQLVNSYLAEACSNRRESESIRETLKGVQEEVTQTRKLVQLVTARQKEASEKLKACQNCDDTLSWKNTHCCRPDDRCRERLDFIRKELEEIMRQYRQDRKAKTLGYNEVQIHKMDKSKLTEKTTLAVSLLRDHCERNWRESHSKLMAWFQQIAPIQANIYTVDSQLTQLIEEEYRGILTEIEAKCAIWETRIQSCRERFSVLFNISAFHQMQDKLYGQKVKPLKGISTVGRLAVDGMEQQVIYRPPRCQKILSPPELCSEASNLSNVSDEVVMISVPRGLKRELEAYEANVDRAKETIEYSQNLIKQMQDLSLSNSRRLLEELQDMSLSIPDQPDSSLVNHIDD